MLIAHSANSFSGSNQFNRFIVPWTVAVGNWPASKYGYRSQGSAINGWDTWTRLQVIDSDNRTIERLAWRQYKCGFQQYKNWYQKTLLMRRYRSKLSYSFVLRCHTYWKLDSYFSVIIIKSRSDGVGLEDSRRWLWNRYKNKNSNY